jgi:uncharacterized protein
MFRNSLFVLIAQTFISSLLAQNYVPELNNTKFKVKNAVEIKADAFPLKDIRLLESPFKQAMDMDGKWLLSLEPDRLLHRFRTNAGLEPKAAVYGGWESESLSGHTLGHYLSACSMLYASTGYEQYKRRIDYVVDELFICQDMRGTGYVGGIPNEDTIFAQVSRGEIKSSGFDLNGGWSPWYTVHKIFAGLMDAYLYADNGKALTVAIKMGDWACNILKNLNEDEFQKMLACEHGGMNEALANLYGLTGNMKYLELSIQFHHKAMLDPLANQQDDLANKHSNTQIPKIIGCARRFELSANPTDSMISQFFWSTIIHNHSYVTGSNSFGEYLGEPGKLNTRLGNSTAETCNTYNMLKLTRHLFARNPQAEFTDYYERALYNHILASQNPVNGMVIYFLPLGQGCMKTYSDSIESFWCCVGSGFENHAKYSEEIYSEGNDGGLYINLFIPSILNWRERKISIRQETDFPNSDHSRITIDCSHPEKFTVHIRYPYWVESGMSVRVNGKAVKIETKASSYITIDREWKKGDYIDIIFPMSLRREPMPDNADRAAIMYGPLVMAGNLGKPAPDPVKGVPVFVTENKPLNEWIRPIPGQSCSFQTVQAGRDSDVVLIPLYRMINEYYNVYWDFFSQAGWLEHKEAYELEKERLKTLDQKSTDFLALAEMQPERDHNLKSENSRTGENMGKNWRAAYKDGYFSFDMIVNPSENMILSVTYWGSDEGNREFEILANDTLIAVQKLEKNNPDKFFDIDYRIPLSISKSKDKLKVTFRPIIGKIAGNVYGCRMLRDR